MKFKHQYLLKITLTSLIGSAFSLSILSNAQARTTEAMLWDPVDGTTTLGNLPGKTYSTAQAANDIGQVVGRAGGGDAFIWDANNGMQLMSGLKDVYDINNNGQVAGYTQGPGSYTHAAVWHNSTGMHDLGTIDNSSGSSYSSDINNLGNVVGRSTYLGSGFHAFSWNESTGMVDIGTLGGRDSSAYGVNDAGNIVGSAQNSSGQHRAFIWDETNGMSDIGSLTGAYSSYASYVNNNGQVAGQAFFSETGYQAFLWDETNGMQLLGFDINSLSGFNDAGQLIGTFEVACTGDGTRCYDSFIWDESTGFQNMNDYMGFETYVSNINNNGQLVGSAEIVTPVPAAIWLFGSGLLGLIGFARKKSVC